MASSSSTSTLSSGSSPSSSRLAIYNLDGSIIEASAAAAPQAAAELKSRVIKLDKTQQGRAQRLFKDKLPLYREYVNGVDRRFIGLHNKYKLEPARVIFFGSALYYVLEGGEEPNEIDMRFQIAPKFSWMTTASKIANWGSQSLPKVRGGFTSEIRNNHSQEYYHFEIHHPDEIQHTDLTIEHAHTPNRTYAEFTSSQDALRATISLSDEEFSTLELHVAQNAFQVSDVLNWNGKGRLRVHPEHARNTKDGFLRIIHHLTNGALFDQPSEIIDNILCETLIEQYKDDYSRLERKIEKLIEKKYKNNIQGAVFFLLNFERFFSKATSALIKPHKSRIQAIILNALCKKRLGCFDLNVSEEGNLLAFCRYYLDNVAAKMVSETGEHFAYGKHYLLPFQGIRIKDQRFTADERLCKELERVFPPKDPDWRNRLIAEAPLAKAKLEEKAESPKAGKAQEATFKTLEEFLDARKKSKNPLQASNQLYTLLLSQPTPPQRKAQLASVVDNLIVQLMKDPKVNPNIYNLILAFFKSIDGQPLQNHKDIEKWIAWFLEKGLHEDALRLYLNAKDSKILDGIIPILLKMSKHVDALPAVATFANTLFAYSKHYDKKEEMMVLEKLFVELFKHIPNGSRFYFYNLTRETIDQFSSPTYFAIFSLIITYTDWDNLSDQTRVRFERFVSRSLNHLRGKPITQDPQDDLNLRALADRIKTKGIYLREDCIRFLKNLPPGTKGLKEALDAIDSDAFRLDREISTTDGAVAFLHHLAEDDFAYDERTFPFYLIRVANIGCLHMDRRGLKHQYIKKPTKGDLVSIPTEVVTKKEYHFTFSEAFDEAEFALADLLKQPYCKGSDPLKLLFSQICITHFAFLRAASAWQQIPSQLKKIGDQTTDHKDVFLTIAAKVINNLFCELEQTRNVAINELLHSPFFDLLIDELGFEEQCMCRLNLALTSGMLEDEISIAKDIKKFDALMQKFSVEAVAAWFNQLPKQKQDDIITLRTRAYKHNENQEQKPLNIHVPVEETKGEETLPLDPRFFRIQKATLARRDFTEVQEIYEKIIGKDPLNEYYALFCMAEGLIKDKINPNHILMRKAPIPKEVFEEAVGYLKKAVEMGTTYVDPKQLMQINLPLSVTYSMLILCYLNNGFPDEAHYYVNRLLREKELSKLQWYAAYHLTTLFTDHMHYPIELDNYMSVLFIVTFCKKMPDARIRLREWLTRRILALAARTHQSKSMPDHPNYELMRSLVEQVQIFVDTGRSDVVDRLLEELETKLKPIK